MGFWQSEEHDGGERDEYESVGGEERGLAIFGSRRVAVRFRERR